MKAVRWRTDCQRCGRSIAVTFDARTGVAYVRSHVSEPGVRCPGSGAATTHDRTYLPA